MNGFDRIQQIREALQSLPAQGPDMMAEAFKNLAPLIEDLNIQQLARGERADGSLLPDYSPVSVLFYGKNPGPMIMHNLGHYWRGIRMVITNNGIELEGTDLKSEMLELRYRDLTGLQDGSIDIVTHDYLPEEIAPILEKKLGIE